MSVDINPAGSSFNDLSMDIDTLEKSAEVFPYSVYINYLLLVQYKKKEHSDYEKAAKKTALYFNNAQWLQFQLSQFEDGSENDVHDAYTNTNHFAVLTEEQIESATNAEEKTAAAKENLLAESEIQQHELLPASENLIEDNSENIVEDAPEIEEEISTKISEPEAYYIEEQAGRIDANATINEEENSIANAEIIAINTEGINEKKAPQVLNGTIENTDSNNLEETFVENQDQAFYPQQEGKKEEEIITNTEPLIIPVAEALQNVSTDEDVIAFEPLHTVDYFASQGIKITDEVFTNDKLGTQMKSFTEWLRSMKKLPNAKMPLQNSLAENIIQSAAESSNIDTEVLTEAMAEVLIKQDKREKAIEMYNKLSLINPAKSAYFAAKIESIKST